MLIMTILFRDRDRPTDQLTDWTTNIATYRAAKNQHYSLCLIFYQQFLILDTLKVFYNCKAIETCYVGKTDWHYDL